MGVVWGGGGVACTIFLLRGAAVVGLLHPNMRGSRGPSPLHERALHGVVVLKAQRLAGVELLAVERELHARLARLLEVAGGQHEAHLRSG